MKIYYETDYDRIRRGKPPVQAEIFADACLVRTGGINLHPNPFDARLVAKIWRMKKPWEQATATIIKRHNARHQTQGKVEDFPFPLLKFHGAVAEFVADPDFHKLPADMQAWMIARQF